MVAHSSLSITEAFLTSLKQLLPLCLFTPYLWAKSKAANSNKTDRVRVHEKEI